MKFLPYLILATLAGCATAPKTINLDSEYRKITSCATIEIQTPTETAKARKRAEQEIHNYLDTWEENHPEGRIRQASTWGKPEFICAKTLDSNLFCQSICAVSTVSLQESDCLENDPYRHCKK